jgi:hypothetical protein
MRTSTFAGLLALAASSTAQFLNQSAPFALVVLSQNETYNGTTLAACHEGAAIEGLCSKCSSSLYTASISPLSRAVANKLLVGATFNYPIPTSVETFTLNYSSSLTVDPAVGQVGLLTYELRGGNFNLSSPMELSYNPSSNVAIPLFTPSESGTEVAFKSDDLMGIPGYLDDTVSPPVYNSETLYRWYICLTNAGYTYTTAAWAMGDTTPENPSCVKADIKRVFA